MRRNALKYDPKRTSGRRFAKRFSGPCAKTGRGIVPLASEDAGNGAAECSGVLAGRNGAASPALCGRVAYYAQSWKCIFRLSVSFDSFDCTPTRDVTIWLPPICTVAFSL